MMLFFYLSSFVRSSRLSNKVSQRNFSSLFFFFTQKLAFKRETKELHSSFQLALRLLLFQRKRRAAPELSNVFFRPLPSLFPWSMRISRRSTFHTLAFCLEENWVSLEMIRKVIDSILKIIRERSELFQKLSRPLLRSRRSVKKSAVAAKCKQSLKKGGKLQSTWLASLVY